MLQCFHCCVFLFSLFNTKQSSLPSLRWLTKSRTKKCLWTRIPLLSHPQPLLPCQHPGHSVPSVGVSVHLPSCEWLTLWTFGLRPSVSRWWCAGQQVCHIRRLVGLISKMLGALLEKVPVEMSPGRLLLHVAMRCDRLCGLHYKKVGYILDCLMGYVHRAYGHCSWQPALSPLKEIHRW